MSNIIKRAAEWALEEPLSEMIQDTFPLRNMQDQDVGTITMLVRLTCFGKTIITKFQIADNKKSFLFKNAKTQDYEFKCKKCMPGQPIQRLRLPPQNEEEEECNEGYWEGGYGSVANASTGLVDKEQMTEGYQDVCNPAMRSSPREMYTQGPGFHRHEVSDSFKPRSRGLIENDRKKNRNLNQVLPQVPGTRVDCKHGGRVSR